MTVLPCALTPATVYQARPRPVAVRSEIVGTTAELNVMTIREMFAHGRLVRPATTWVREPQPTDVSAALTCGSTRSIGSHALPIQSSNGRPSSRSPSHPTAAMP